jgi:DNA-binding CsgD family transcriptional regulator
MQPALLEFDDALERAQALTDLGTALRRAGRPLEAREPLRLALDLAYRSGATALEEQALADLRATGARPRRRVVSGPGALTSSERRIAELAAAGHQNREIAEDLWVTLATVEFHLRNAYRKLGIRRRTQLPGALDGRDIRRFRGFECSRSLTRAAAAG